MTSSRRHHLKSLMLQIAAGLIEQEKKDIEAAKQAYMAENCPAPDLSGDQAALMVRPRRHLRSNAAFRRHLVPTLTLNVIQKF
ncbi:troponin I, fast skeletal muscle-like [Seriola lalandi dorsalis]|uniref:troponin I, fast skeletal muscle-like n=1 Tax=Seriola lalandi dorsalis TaxID=1841481 RepID=UPI000C6F5696|nr:troponin I, fast skeletal muscle-like [Seriola lalandi dorsalis]